MAWENIGGKPKYLGPCTYGDPGEVPGSYLQTGPALAIEDIWGVDQWIESLSVSSTHFL